MPLARIRCIVQACRASVLLAVQVATENAAGADVLGAAHGVFPQPVLPDATDGQRAMGGFHIGNRPFATLVRHAGTREGRC